MPARVVDERMLEFLRLRVMVAIASRSPDHVPSLTRAGGFRVFAEAQRFAVFVHTRHAERLLADVQATGQVATVFSEPGTHRTLQVKGADASVGPLDEGDWSAVIAHTEAAVAELGPLGYSEAWVRTLLQATPAKMTAIRFTAESAFGQTPGPAAGAPLAGKQP